MKKEEAFQEGITELSKFFENSDEVLEFLDFPILNSLDGSEENFAILFARTNISNTQPESLECINADLIQYVMEKYREVSNRESYDEKTHDLRLIANNIVGFIAPQASLTHNFKSTLNLEHWNLLVLYNLRALVNHLCSSIFQSLLGNRSAEISYREKFYLAADNFEKIADIGLLSKDGIIIRHYLSQICMAHNSAIGLTFSYLSNMSEIKRQKMIHSETARMAVEEGVWNRCNEAMEAMKPLVDELARKGKKHHEIAEALVRMEVDGEPLAQFTTSQNITKPITKDQIKRFVCKYFRETHRKNLIHGL